MLLLLLGTIQSIRSVDSYVVVSPLSSASTRIKQGGIGSIETPPPSFAGTSSRPRTLRLRSSDSSDAETSEKEDNSSPSNSLSSSSSSSSATTIATDARFGDVAPLKRKPSSVDSVRFGDVVSISKPSSSESSSAPPMFAEAAPKQSTTAAPAISDVELLKQRRTRNLGVAILSIALAVGNYAYQWTHPVTPIQLLVNMERSSSPLADIGKNSKPTVIDFWAPWCENCRYMAPTLFQIEESYKDKVNFVMVNGDDPNNWPLIEALGVDAIPHLALVESDGTVDTALIGTVPKEWLSRDIDVLLSNANGPNGETTKQSLPYQMLDVFVNRPEARKIVDLDSVVEAAKR